MLLDQHGHLKLADFGTCMKMDKVRSPVMTDGRRGQGDSVRPRAASVPAPGSPRTVPTLQYSQVTLVTGIRPSAYDRGMRDG